MERKKEWKKNKYNELNEIYLELLNYARITVNFLGRSSSYFSCSDSDNCSQNNSNYFDNLLNENIKKVIILIKEYS